MLKFKNEFETRILSKVVVSSSNCWEYQGNLTKGYGVFSFSNKKLYTHRASYMYHYGKFPDSLHVLHKCDNPCCINPEHLFLGNHQDNMLDKTKKGRSALKLTEAAVIDIFLSNDVTEDIANKYSISNVLVNRIRRREQWQWLTDGLETPVRYREGKGTYTELPIIKEIYFSNKRICDLVKEYGLARQAIRKIKTKQSWKTYTDALDKELEI